MRALWICGPARNASFDIFEGKIGQLLSQPSTLKFLFELISINFEAKRHKNRAFGTLKTNFAVNNRPIIALNMSKSVVSGATTFLNTSYPNSVHQNYSKLWTVKKTGYFSAIKYFEFITF